MSENVTVDMQGSYSLEYGRSYDPSEKPIQYIYDGGGAEYIEVQYEGKTYCYGETERWLWYDDGGFEHRVEGDSDLNDTLNRIMSGNFWDIVSQDRWRRVERLLPGFLEENNLEIFYAPDDRWANFGVYYVAEKGKKIDTEIHNMDDWRDATGDAWHIKQLARIILGIKRIDCGVKYYQRLECPDYAREV